MADSLPPDARPERLTEQKFILSMIFIVGTVAMFVVLMFSKIPEDNRDIIISLVSVWTGVGFASMVKFNFDGTKSGDQKNDTIAAQAKTAAVIADTAASIAASSPPLTPAPGTAQVVAAADVDVEVRAAEGEPPKRTPTSERKPLIE